MSRRFGLGGGLLGGAGLVGFFAFAALTAAAILGLAMIPPAAIAAVIVGGAYALLAGVMALLGKTKLQEAMPPVPEEAAESTKEDISPGSRRSGWRRSETLVGAASPFRRKLASSIRRSRGSSNARAS